MGTRATTSGLRRRQFLRGTLGGAAVTMGLPLLDGFLNTNGTALAATGAPLPRRFGTWFFGCGITPERWIPRARGAHWATPPELAPISTLQDRINILSGYSVLLNGEANIVHHTGVVGALCGAPSPTGTACPPRLDEIISRHLSKGTPLSTLHLSPTSALRSAHNSHRPAKYGRSATAADDPTQLYAQLFTAPHAPGAACVDAHTAALLDNSVLSVVSEERRRLQRQLGARDRNRFDAYCTNLRTLETRLAAENTPAFNPRHRVNTSANTDAGCATASHRTMAQLAALALASDQTQVVNMVLSTAHCSLALPGSMLNHHQLTHQEPVDRTLGYRPLVSDLVRRQMHAWSEFVSALDAIPEGDGTLLDNCLIMALSDTGDAATHSVTGLPVMTAGSAGGRLRTGLHIDGAGGSISRIGLTLQRAMGLRVAHWGSAQNWTDEPISALLV